MKKKGFWIGVIGLLGLFVGVSPVEATHFRFGHLTWELDETTRVRFTFTAAFRRDAYHGSGADGLPVRGDIIREDIGRTSLCFGDRDCTDPLYFLVTSANPTENWIVGVGGVRYGEQTIEHFYFTAGEFVAFSQGCCRIADRLPPNAHINNPSGSYRLETKVLLRSP